MSKLVFKFKNFNLTQSDSLHKIGTDAMVLGASVDCANPKSILDVGTGCGILALMLAQSFPKAKIVGVDIDDNAISLANSNFQNAPFHNNFSAERFDFLNYNPSIHFDLIVSNPPYFNSNMPSILQQRNIARHEDSMNLVQLINHSEELLNEDGELWIIVPYERTEELIALKNRLNLKLFHRIQIYGKPNRHVRDVLVFSAKQKSEILPTELTIRDNDGKYTQQYIDLTKPYHYNQL